MKMKNRLNPNHEKQKKKLKRTAKILIFLGTVLFIAACVNIFTNPFKNEWLNFFWVLGPGIIFSGGFILFIANQGNIARYLSREVAPVAADTANFIVDETKGSIKTVSKSISEGLKEGVAGEESLSIEEKITKLKSLYDKGLISYEEFQTTKKELLKDFID